jgi:hypothetical protein
MKTYLKHIHLILVVSCFFYASCQLSGGDFVPVLSDGAILKSMFSKENSALQYNNEKFSIKVASGEWGVKGHSTFWLILKNNDASKVVIDLDKILLKSSFDQKLNIYSISSLFPIDKSKNTPQKVETVITKGEIRAYVLNISDDNQKEMYKREKYLGQTISLTIPVKIDLENKNYEFQFTYGDYLPQGEYNETLID